MSKKGQYLKPELKIHEIAKNPERKSKMDFDFLTKKHLLTQKSVSDLKHYEMDYVRIYQDLRPIKPYKILKMHKLRKSIENRSFDIEGWNQEQPHILDLHGYCQDLSYVLLMFFLQYAKKSGFRTVRIITGKGAKLRDFVQEIIGQLFKKASVEDLGGAFLVRM